MPSLADWKPSDFRYIPKVLNILTEYSTVNSVCCKRLSKNCGRGYQTMLFKLIFGSVFLVSIEGHIIHIMCA